MTTGSAKAPKFLADLLTYTADVVTTHGSTRAQAARIAEEVAARMRHKWGGQVIYFPIARRANQDKRDAAIVREFNGRNHAQLARKHGVSVNTVYSAIRRNNSDKDRKREG